MQRITHFWRFFFFVVLAGILAGCAKDMPVFVPPAQRTIDTLDQSWRGGLLTLAYHDIEDASPDQAFLSVRTDHLIEQLAWLRENGYVAVNVDQILAARAGVNALPPRAVLLTFDDGYRSFYTRVFPILKAYNWPFVFAPVGAWLDVPEGQPVDFGGLKVPRERFMTWQQVSEMSKSPLVEVGAHTDQLHRGELANPQGNQQPSASTRIYDAERSVYETDAEFKERVRRDTAAITEKVLRATGKAPRVWVWPYGSESGTALKVIGEQGYEMALTLENGLGALDRLMNTPRVLLSADAQTRSVANAAMGTERSKMLRVMHVDLDYVYDTDPAQLDRNLGQLVQRVKDMGISSVFLQAYADPTGDGLVRSVYFPNRWLPVRADLFNRAAWQLRNRAGVDVFAWMPVLSFDLESSLPRVTRIADSGVPSGMTKGQYVRLSPFDPTVRQKIGDLYEDLARQASFNGLLFHDDAVLSDFEDSGPAALAAYQLAGFPPTVEQIRSNAVVLQRWSRFKSRYLIDFTHELTQRVRAVRGNDVMTARNIFALPILAPESEAWFAQNLDDFLGAYDWTAPMAMPLMEGVSENQSHPWLDALVDAVARRSGALERTVFEVQTKDWQKPGAPAVDSAVIANWMRRIQLRGAKNFGYYPDDFSRDEPRLKVVRPAISNAWYPYHE